ncbi:type II secretion system F family protein [Chitinasiproducens palmae]|uniref:Tight adherence protein C n=1 Tax=Chitinasiproducens palmae TaxID=1770053 RepID=A0A1H2PV83_9BURK|nr:type II secretion system F family protein [Chitinasiproducens palmae]SDV51156.1 tight adherence protein C [Chitinasiproducens palmae]
MSALSAFSETTLASLACLALASAFLLIGAAVLARLHMQSRRRSALDRMLHAREAAAAASPAADWRQRVVEVGSRGAASGLGRQLVADDDRALLDRCGYDDPRGRALFFLSRAGLAVLLPLLGVVLFGGGSMMRWWAIVFFGFALGYMAPKFFLLRQASLRRRRADTELPLLVDLLRLLQGVGLGIDQSLQLIEDEMHGALPVLSYEIALAATQYRGGRARQQALQRFATVFRNDDLAAVASLIVQLDRFGGGVQEQLRQFGERVRERQRFEMKARAGKLTVKMTAVMVLTLLPALLVVTGGAGFLAVIRGLSRLGG